MLRTSERVLYPENASFWGATVADVYVSWKELPNQEYLIYTLKELKSHYEADIFVWFKITPIRFKIMPIGGYKPIYIDKDDYRLCRVQRKLAKKVKQGYMTEKQKICCILTTVCMIIEERLDILKDFLNDYSE